ncbi:hydroxymethylglutaryl-CoA synthase [Globicatella sulfidifaciens]|uniref:Hydroxymethylglutaryl-CoA synthase n=1 Tax=Globicatella sulfidifaciens TaxID=136093 RepID=A0A7X8C334_9LACT|nr:hydroxymethylglutaryl-CoA synthase [Globicatella sulfidifaciens]NLJ17932.1 hydroxymethylglutaryl-CoA synthase [Globicatella sulfidifaciens]
MKELEVGIDKIGLYVPKYYIDMKELATYRGVDPNKWTIGIGQEQMAVPTLASDVVALAANAANQIITEEDKGLIDQVIVGTESGVDHSKSIATFVHGLLEMNPFAKAFEIKQACYGATAALQLACDYVRLRPERKVLVIATDISRYGLDTSGEPTQGAGAIAMLVSAKPKILTIRQESFMHTNHQFDFWRPNDSEYAMVDGHFSTKLYQDEFVKVLEHVEAMNPSLLERIEAMTFHLPFTKMGLKALNAYEEAKGSHPIIDKWRSHYDASRVLNRRVGNIYTGSLFLSLISLLAKDDTLSAGETIGLFSYGSGAVSELLIGQLQPDYRQYVNSEEIEQHLDRRDALTVEQYETIFLEKQLVNDGQSAPLTADEVGFYFAGITDYKRQYHYQA